MTLAVLRERVDWLGDGGEVSSQSTGPIIAIATCRPEAGDLTYVAITATVLVLLLLSFVIGATA
ncbi:MAG: hypothetical protein ACREOQ_18915 [Gemmatimonadales bacterium]